jgi:DNA-binding CsgD family transcriptional regulator
VSILELEPKHDSARVCRGRDPQAIRASILEAVARVGEVDFALFYNLVEVEGVTYVGDWQAVGDGGLCDRIMGPFTREPWPGVRYLRAHSPDRRTTRSFMEWGALLKRQEVESSDFYQRVYAPHGLGDQIRLLVYHGSRFIGWLGGVRRAGTPVFTRNDRRRLRTVVAASVDGLITADTLARQGQPLEPGYLVLSEEGRVVMVSDAAKPWLERPRFMEALRALVGGHAGSGHPESRAVLREAEARVVRLEEDGRPRYLVHVVPVRTLKMRAHAGLTPAQREVVELAAAGASATDVARLTGRKEETVRTYLRQAYAHLGVASRVELAQALETQEITPRPR